MKISLLSDERFVRGFHLKGLNSIRDGHAPIKAFSVTGETPIWLLCQWNSKYNLINGNFTKNEDEYKIFDVSKCLTVTGGEKLTFALDAGKEYTAPRAPDEPWPHLLIEQEITQNNRVCDFENLVCHAFVQLEDLENLMSEEETKGHHTTQFVWVVTLKDNNPSSPSYNRFMWVVMPILDSRYEFCPGAMTQDMALPDGEFLYCFPSEKLLNKSIWTREKVEFHLDLAPYVPHILSSAQKLGFMLGTQLEDLVLSSMNMGFEITGTFRSVVSVEQLSITAKRR